MYTKAMSPNVGKTKIYNKQMSCLIKEDLEKDGLSFKIDFPEPSLGLTDVRIRVLATAICGTDKSIYNSLASEIIRKEMRRYLLTTESYHPIVVGHEFCGIVEEVGEGITSFQVAPSHLCIEPGDYVTAEMHLACGQCKLCWTGNGHICTNVRLKGLHLNGCFAERVVVPYKNVVLLGKAGDMSQVPPHIGAMLDAFGNAVHTVCEANVAGKSVAILGAGPLGLMATFLCRTFGAARIYLTEVVDVERRFALASEFGADYCIDVSTNANELYRLVSRGEHDSNGVDVVLEMSGAPSAYEDAFRVVGNGGKVVLLGIPRAPLSKFDITNGVIWKGVTVKGIYGRRMFDTWETMLSLIKAEKLDLKGKLTKLLCQKFFLLEEYEEAFHTLGAGKELKVVFTPDGSLQKK